MAKALRGRLGAVVAETDTGPCRDQEHDDMLDTVADLAVRDNI